MTASDYNDAKLLEQVTTDLMWADWPRGYNRSLIAGLANGDAPFSEEEAEEMNLKTNINNLGHCRLLHKSRTTFANGFFQQGQYLTTRTDYGPIYKRDNWARIFEKEVNQKLIDSVQYFESLRSKFGLLVLHGIGPSMWRNSYDMLPRPIGVADLLVPTNTELGFANLPIFCTRKSLTGMELSELVIASKRDPGWNMPMVKTCLEWIDSEMRNGLDTSYKDYYRPEKWEEEQKQQAGCYMGDRVPTIDVFDVYAYVEATTRNKAGWVRRIIIDSWSNQGPGIQPKRLDRKGLDKPTKSSFIFSSGSRPVADTWNQIVSVQYADLSAVFPAMHNAVRSLGWLTYGQCHIDNRFECRMFDSGFEQLMQYFQVSSDDGVQRAMKVELAHLGFIDPTIKMIPAADRFQPNAGFIELVRQHNKKNITDSSDGFSQNPDGAGNSKTEKTKTQYIAELQMMAAFVSAALNQAYMYQKYEDQEIVRRVLRPNSKDPLVRSIRERCLRQGIPEALMNDPDKWNVQHERMMGQGNQTLEMMVAQELLQMAPGLDPEPQRIVKRNFITTLTHNPQLALELMPEKPAKVTTATHMAENDCSSMLHLIQVEPMTGINHQEYIGKALQILGSRVKMGEQTPQKMVDKKELQGMQLIADAIAKQIKILEPDKTMGPYVKKASDALGQLVNKIKAFEQRLEAAQKKQQQDAAKQNGSGGGADIMAKVLPAVITAKAKAKIKEGEAAQKSKHKEIAFMQEIKHKKIRTNAEVASQDLRTAAEIHRSGLTAFNEQDEPEGE